MLNKEYLQKLADEFCEEKGIPPVDVTIADARSLSFIVRGSYYPFKRKIEIQPYGSEHDLKHELRHHFLSSKTKNITCIFGSPVTYYASLAGMFIGNLLNNDYLFDLSSIFWTGRYLGEAYADFHKGGLKDLVFDLAMLSFPLVLILSKNLF